MQGKSRFASHKFGPAWRLEVQGYAKNVTIKFDRAIHETGHFLAQTGHSHFAAIGQTVSHYRIIEKLGGGGMGFLEVEDQP